MRWVVLFILLIATVSAITIEPQPIKPKLNLTFITNNDIKEIKGEAEIITDGEITKMIFNKTTGVLKAEGIIDNATIRIPHNKLSPLITMPKLYIKEDDIFELAETYHPLITKTKSKFITIDELGEKFEVEIVEYNKVEDTNRTMNSLRIYPTYYEFDVEHFTEYNVSEGTNFYDLTQALFWLNGTDGDNIVILDNHSYYNNSQHDYINTSSFNTTGLVLAYNLEDIDRTNRNVKDSSGAGQNGTAGTGVDWVEDASYIMQTGMRFNRTGDDYIDANQNLQSLRDGNYSFLIGGLKVYPNISASYTNVLGVWGQLNPATFAGTSLFYTIGDSDTTLMFGDVAPGGNGEFAQASGLTYGAEYCVGGTHKRVNDTTWNITLYVVGHDGEQIDNHYSTTSPDNGGDNLFIGQDGNLAGAVDVSPNMTMGSIAFYNDSHYLTIDEIRDYCYGRLDKYHGYGEHNDGRIRINARENISIIGYSLDSDNYTTINRLAIYLKNVNDNIKPVNFLIQENTIKGFHQQLVIGGSTGEEPTNMTIKNNFFDSNIKQDGSILIFNTYMRNSTYEGNTFNATERVSIADIYGRNITIKDNNFTNINNGYLQPADPYPVVILGLVAATSWNYTVKNNYFGDINNGSALIVIAKNSTITNNTFHKAQYYKADDENYGAIVGSPTSRNINVYLNNFYGSGVNRTAGNNMSFCYNGQGNFYEENINESWIAKGDCGRFNSSSNSTYKRTITVDFKEQDSNKDITYTVYANGVTALGMVTVNGSVVVPLETTFLTYIPNDGEYNATNVNVTLATAPYEGSMIYSHNKRIKSYKTKPKDYLYDCSDTDLMLGLRFDEDVGSTTWDCSGHDNNGTITKANWTTGKYNYALDFNTSGVDASRVVVADDDSLHIEDNEEYTIEFWIKPHNYTFAARTIFNQYANLGGIPPVFRGYFATMTGYTHPTNPHAITVYEYHSLFDSQSLTTSSFAVDEWSHVVILRNCSLGNLSMYINGNLNLTDTTSCLNITSGTELVIGSTSTYVDTAQAVIDSFAIYNRSLTASEIQSHYESNKKSYLVVH